MFLWEGIFHVTGLVPEKLGSELDKVITPFGPGVAPVGFLVDDIKAMFF
jgi:hypothetical protein